MEMNIIICADTTQNRNSISVLCYRHIIDAPSILKCINISGFYGLSTK